MISGPGLVTDRPCHRLVGLLCDSCCMSFEWLTMFGKVNRFPKRKRATRRQPFSVIGSLKAEESALRELEAPAGFRTAVLLAFNNAGVTGQEPG